MGTSNIKCLYVIKNMLLKDYHWIILNSLAECFKGAKNTRVHFSGMEVPVFLGIPRKVKKPCAG